MYWLDYLQVAVLQAVITAAVWYLASYLNEKGKNLATKEDIKEITDKIESVKTEYAKDLESLKSQLNAKFHAHTVRFEKEFQILERVWNGLIELRNAAEAFTPGPKSGPIDQDKDKERFGEAYYKFLGIIDVHKPFYSKELFDLLEEYRRRQLRYIRDHEFMTQPGFQAHWVKPDFWDKRDENLQEIRKLCDDVCQAIRKRTKSYEWS
jgi:hypothetical protein